VTQLRKMMLEELQRRNYSQHTTRQYIRTVEDFARLVVRPTSLSRWEKLGRGGTEDETVKPLDGVQRVQVPHGQSEQAGR
jgi:hypothetical protein